MEPGGDLSHSSTPTLVDTHVTTRHPRHPFHARPRFSSRLAVFPRTLHHLRRIYSYFVRSYFVRKYFVHLHVWSTDMIHGLHTWLTHMVYTCIHD